MTGIGVLLNQGAGGAPLLGTFDGQAVYVASYVFLKSTFIGDSNLDGHIDGFDYSKIDNGFLTKTTGWSNGDFNYDGVIDGSDYTLIDNAFNTQGAAIPSAQIAQSNAAASRISRAGIVPAESCGEASKKHHLRDWFVAVADSSLLG